MKEGTSLLNLFFLNYKTILWITVWKNYIIYMKWTNSQEDTKYWNSPEEIDYLNGPITNKETELIILKLPIKKSQDPDVFPGKFLF